MCCLLEILGKADKSLVWPGVQQEEMAIFTLSHDDLYRGGDDGGSRMRRLFFFLQLLP